MTEDIRETAINTLHFGRPADVVLVLMPYITPAHPSPGLGILKASLISAGVSARVIYANLLFMRMIGYDPYQLAAKTGGRNRVGDWTFAGSAFPDYRPPEDDYLRRSARGVLGDDGTAEREEIAVTIFRKVRGDAKRFVDSLARAIIENKPKVVGCSSTFEQHVASLALLRRIKELSPRTATIIGGANCEGVMGATTVREFPWIDIAFSGEADEAIVPLCRLLIERGRGIPAEDLPIGAINRELAERLKSGVGPELPTATVSDLDRVPIPDYDDYFSQLKTAGDRERFKTGLVMETSRGCWWRRTGEGCTFCGLNQSATTFRSKSPDRVSRELEFLSRRYHERKIEMTDNIIPPGYFKTLFPRLAAEGRRYRIFYEMRAGLSRDEIRLMAEAGVVLAQIGIESLHDGMLGLMRKGTTTAENLASLKYMREFGIRPIWHFLFGFPGEDDDWHYQVAEWLPMVHHLPPPKLCLPLLLQRFSAYHCHPDRYGPRLTPHAAYKFSYPLPDETLDDLVYYFEGDSPPKITPGIRKLMAAIQAWKTAYHSPNPPLLWMTDQGERIVIMDTRRHTIARRTSLSGCAARIYRACAEPVIRRDLARLVNRDGGAQSGTAEIDAAVAELKRQRLILDLHGQLLSLALAGEVPEPIPLIEFPGGLAPRANFRRLFEMTEATEKER